MARSRYAFHGRGGMRARFFYWADRMKRDAQIAREYQARNFLAHWFNWVGGHWSHTLTREECRLLMKSEHPILDHPDIVKRFVQDGYPYISLRDFNDHWETYSWDYRVQHCPETISRMLFQRSSGRPHMRRDTKGYPKW